MSCPDWTRLVALREGADAEPAEWTEAMAHLDACPRCRREAVAADPLLVFRRLPAVEHDERAEAESMCQAVAAMRTARRLESRQRFAGWRRWAAAAVLAVASLAVSWDKAPRPEPAPAIPKAAELAPAAPLPAAGGATLEPLDGSDARVYQMNGQGVTAFMIVDHKLDV